MSTSVDEIVEFHEAQAERARLVAKRYPKATHETYLGLATFIDAAAKHNRLEALVDGDGHAVLVPYELLGDGKVRGRVRRPVARERPAWAAMEFLREKYPDAYADLVKWVSR